MYVFYLKLNEADFDRIPSCDAIPAIQRAVRFPLFVDNIWHWMSSGGIVLP